MADKKCAYSVDMILSKNLILRLALGGMLFFMGYNKLLGGTAAFVAAVSPAFANTILPAKVVEIFLTIVPTAETLIGVLLVVGLFTAVAARFAALLFAIFVIGLSAQNSPDAGFMIVGVFIYIFAAFKICCSSHSIISLDHLKNCKGMKCME